MNESQQKKLAIDIVERRVFGTFNMKIHELDMLPLIFMPIVFINDKDRPEKVGKPNSKTIVRRTWLSNSISTKL